MKYMTLVTLLAGMTTVASAQVGAVSDAYIVCRTNDVFPGAAASGGGFGTALAYLGDLDGPGPGRFALAIGNPRVSLDGSGHEHGQVFIAHFTDDGALIPESVQHIPSLEGESEGRDRFGRGLEAIGDLDGDGIPELAVGGHSDSDCGVQSGALWVLFLDTLAWVKLGACTPALAGQLGAEDRFGNDVAPLGTWSGPCGEKRVIAVGADGDDDGAGDDRGAVWIMFLNPDGTAACVQKISQTQGGFGGTLPAGSLFGAGLAGLGDLDGDGVPDLAVGAPGDDHGGGDGAHHGAVWILLMNLDGTVKDQTKIAWDCLEDSSYEFGTYLSTLGVIDATGDTVLAVGAPGTNGHTQMVWLLWLDGAGAMTRHLLLHPGEGGLPDSFDVGGNFGRSVAAIDDLQGDGVPDVVVGSPGNDCGGPNYGALWILSLHDHGCPADVDFNGNVGFEDLLRVLTTWATDGCKSNSDVDRNGTVDFVDLLSVLTGWGDC